MLNPLTMLILLSIIIAYKRTGSDPIEKQYRIDHINSIKHFFALIVHRCNAIYYKNYENTCELFIEF